MCLAPHASVRARTFFSSSGLLGWGPHSWSPSSKFKWITGSLRSTAPLNNSSTGHIFGRDFLSFATDLVASFPKRGLSVSFRKLNSYRLTRHVSPLLAALRNTFELIESLTRSAYVAPSPSQRYVWCIRLHREVALKTSSSVTFTPPSPSPKTSTCNAVLYISTWSADAGFAGLSVNRLVKDAALAAFSISAAPAPVPAYLADITEVKAPTNSQWRKVAV
mmetsp:Transcript_33028/g.78887  ORF Transcript_33028/g.78887 Transcript_33028/m.78887 type:complete len:220 (-) Transcript_33028:264-923(-)